MSQILNIDHLEYLVSFMRMKLNKLDRTKKEQDLKKPGVGEQTGASSITTTAWGGSLVHFHLGAPENKEKPLLDLTCVTRFSVPDLARMLETFINKTRTIEEGYYKVQKEHMVIVFFPF